MVAPPLGSPISLAGMLSLTKSAQFTAAPAGDHAAAARIAAVLPTSAVFNLNMGTSSSVHRDWNIYRLPLGRDSLCAGSPCGSERIPVFRRSAPHGSGQKSGIVVRFERSQARSGGGFGRASELVLRLFLSTVVVAIGPPALGSGVGDNPAAPQQQNRNEEQNYEPEPSASPAVPDSPSAPSTRPDNLCEAIATAAA